MAFEIKKQNGYGCDDFTIRYESEIIDGEILDTKVLLDNGDSLTRLCWISGESIKEFDKKLTELFGEYRI